MEKNKFSPVSGNDLDKLLNQAFLDLDFDQARHQQMLDAIGHQTLNKSPFSFHAIKNLFLNKIFLSVFVMLTAVALWLFVQQANQQETITAAKLPDEKQQTQVIESIQAAQVNVPIPIEEPKPVDRHIAKAPAVLIPVASAEVPVEAKAMAQEVVMLSGYIKSAKNGSTLAGALVYQLHSAATIASSERGYFALSLAKGEHSIGITMPGYKTLTVVVNLTEDLTRDFMLQEVWKQLDEVTVDARGGYIFPNLTAWEIKANEREKRNMVRRAAKVKQGQSSQSYISIPVPANQALNNFHIGETELTNLEYRTFLFDLLIHGRKEEFLAAKPDQQLWLHAGGVSNFDTLSLIYFSTRKYNDYPVVNVPVAGVKLYCEWLTQQANALREKERKPPIEVRLPYEQEWLHAASAGHPEAVYPWYTDSVQNRYNWFLANCCIQKQTEKLSYPFNKTDRHPLGQPNKFDLQGYTSAGMSTNDRKMATAPVFCFNPNGFNLFAVCGNVSEIVYSPDGKTLKTKGGNWNSDAEHLKFTSEDEFKEGVKASPMIGFRVCVVVKEK